MESQSQSRTSSESAAPFSEPSSTSSESTWSEADVILQIRFILEGLVLAFICHLGLFGNLLSMFILLKKKLDLQPFLCQLLVLLVIFDTVFLIADFLTYSLPVLSKYYHDHVYPVLSPLCLLPLSQVRTK